MRAPRAILCAWFVVVSLVLEIPGAVAAIVRA